MDLNEVAIFIKVVQKGSFTSAAAVLDMPKSTVSAKVISLEKRLGMTLLKRSTRKLRLTQAGEAFFLRSTKAIDEIMAAEVAIKSENAEPHGRLRISAPVDIGNNILPELIAPFVKRYSKVQVEVILTERKVDFLEEEVDLVIRAGELKDSSLIAKKAGEDEFRVFASPKYLKDRGAPKDPKDIAGYDCILVHSILATGWQMQNGKRTLLVPLTGKILVNDLNLARGLAIQGAGLAFLPSYLCQGDIKAGKLVSVLDAWSSKLHSIHFVYPAQRYVPPATKAFIEMSTLILQNRLRLPIP